MQLKQINNLVVKLHDINLYIPRDSNLYNQSSLSFGIFPVIHDDRTETFRYGRVNNRLTNTKEEIDFIETFNIRLVVTCSDVDCFFNNGITKSNTVEEVSYKTKLNPSHYTIFERQPLGFLDEEDMIEQGIDINDNSRFFINIQWDYEKLYNDFPEFKALTDNAATRVYNHYNYKNTTIVLKEGERSNKYEGFVYYDEYLKCDEQTSFGGNYGENEDLVHVQLKESYNYVRYNKVDSPYNLINNLLMTVISLSNKEQELNIKQILANIDEDLMENRPYRLCLSGNDDCSYSKSFYNLEDATDELKYLTAMQPLNMDKDILDRGYIFTN